MATDIADRLAATLPRAIEWIDSYIEKNGAQSKPVASFRFSRLSDAYPDALLSQAKLALVQRVESLPVHEFGFPELAQVSEADFAGITFKDTFFVANGQLTESLCFHELVHVVQWRVLGPERFLKTYAMGLFTDGYRDSPLEDIAYTLQDDFDRNNLAPHCASRVADHATACWAKVAPTFSDEVGS